MNTNVLYYGDNLPILQNKDYFPDGSVDLVYLDPPFNSKADYNVLFREASGESSQAQIRAFSDFWHWDPTTAWTYQYLVTKAPLNVSKMIEALCNFIGHNDMTAYLVMMAARLIELHRVLKPTGSIYLHCDPTASHYLKVVMDAILGKQNFHNEIVWKRTSAHSDVVQGARHFGRIHDILLFYSKASDYTWHTVHVAYDDQYVEETYRYVDSAGRRYQTQPLHARKPGGDTLYEWKGKKPPLGRYWAFSKANMERLDEEGRIVYSKTGTPRYKIYLDESQGVPAQDLWTDLTGVHYHPSERLGYPTQKPLTLLERIIQTSSNPGDIVLDPFCGCGTAVVAAQKLGRQWIGIDVTHLSIAVMRKRLQDSFPGLKPEVIGEPVDLEGARALARQDRYQFQWWSLSLVGAMPLGDDRKTGADKGMDGVITFMDANGGKSARAIVQVKSGHVSSAQIRDLKGVMEREKAAIGLFITLEPPTRDMNAEAVAAGFHRSDLWQREFRRIQILTIEDLLAGEKPEVPGQVSPYAQAQRVRPSEGFQRVLEGIDFPGYKARA
ncbi:MAG: restriction endonuclease [Chloroflexi bacterium]|nr:restriction endonuclease [Chloroflexota bacterium]